jgi:hypothetical protein
VTEPAPDIFTRYGARLLGPWNELDEDTRAAWLALAAGVEAERRRGDRA